jgi:hypothetical protein
MFRVRHGSCRLARLLVRLARLPAAGDEVAVRLAVIPRRAREEWRRTFAGCPLVSLQWWRPDGLLAERVGLLELRYRLKICEGALLYEPAGTALCLGPLLIPLPRWLGPCVSAREMPGADKNQTHVAVDVRTPWLGLLLAYEGTMTKVEVHA